MPAVALIDSLPCTDAELLALFRQWVEEERALSKYAQAGTDNEDGGNRRSNANWERIRQIASVPATDSVGLAIKAYLFAWWESGGSWHDPAAVSGLDTDGSVSTQILLSLVRDLPRFVPEMAPLIRCAQKGEQPTP